MWYIVKKDELYHHGVLGMKWGKRNGPPYPLSASKHSSSEKKAGWRKSLGGGRNENLYGTKQKRKSSTGPNSKKYHLNAEDKKKAKALEKRNSQYRRSVEDPSTVKRQRIINSLLSVLGVMSLNPFLAVPTGKAVYDDAAARLKMRKYFKKREKTEADPKTGFHKKTKQMSIKEDTSKVNPGYKTFDTQIKRQNCMLCMATYDMRRRGYDVTAQYTDIGFFPSEAIPRWYPKAKMQTIKADNTKALNRFGKNVISELVEQGDGARGLLGMDWVYGGGHAVSYEVQKGKLLVIDPQSNKIYKNPDKLFNNEVSEVYYARLDNVEPNMKEIKECCR